MSAICGRCKERDAAFECADCVGSKRRGELLPLCDGCNELIHVGFLEEHQVVSVSVKQQKTNFEEELANFKSQGKHLQLKLNEINYAKQDIEQRAQYNKQAVSQAFQALWQALKQKEQELAAPLRDSSKGKAAQLAEYEGTISRATAEFQTICTEAQKLLQGNSVDFVQRHDQMKKKLEEFQVDRVNTPFPTLGRQARVDMTGLLQSIKDLCLLTTEDGEGTPDDGDTSHRKSDDVEQDHPPGQQDTTTPDLQSPKQGDTLQVYVESRMDTKGNFWVSRNLSEDTANVYEDLSFSIRQDFVESPLSQVEIVEGMLCCGQYQEDHRWYRGRVEQVKRDKGLARVRWLDYAHDNEVPLSSVHPLKEEFQTVPFQALECCLFQDLEEDVPHQARWEFSDHTANALLTCTILQQMSTASSGVATPVYLVDLKNTSKEVDIKEKVLEKVDEAKSKKDSITCRDIRYMKDYVPPISKATSVKKETALEKTKGDSKEAKEPTKDETDDVGVSKGDKEDVSKEGEGTDDVGHGREDSGKNQQGSAGENNGDQKLGIAAAVTSGEDDPTGSSKSITSDQKDFTEDEKPVAVGTSGNAMKPTPAAVQILKRHKALPVQNQSEDGQGTNGYTDKPGGEISDRENESTPSCPEASTSEGRPLQSPAQNGQLRDAHSAGDKPDNLPDGKKDSDSKRSPAADAGVYSLEPDGDEEEGDDHRLIELLARQGDRAMAHSPDNAFSDRAAANSVGMAYYEGGSRQYPYGGSAGYHMGMGAGMYGGAHHPLVALGLNPIVPSVEACGGSTSINTKSDHGSFTGDGFKIVVDSSFSICVATPLSGKGRFWASRLRGPAQESQLRRLMHDISMPSEPLTLERLKEVKVVCAQAESGQWCRAKVEGFQDEKVQVRYVDFGQADVVEEQRVKVLPVAFQLFPYQALELSIATGHHRHFSEKAREAFWKYTQGRTLTAKVIADEAKIVYVALCCMDENQLTYDISSAVLSVNAETVPPSSAEERTKDKQAVRETPRGNPEDQNGGPACDDYRYADNQDVRYDPQSEGRSHDRGAGDRCFVCNNFGHLSYDCPSKGRDPRDRNDRNYRNKGQGGSKKQQGWGRRNRKY